MSPITIEQAVQIFAWTIALAEFMVAGYTLALNTGQGINLNLAGFLFLLAINSSAIGAMHAAKTVTEATVPAIFLAASLPMIQPLLLSFSISLFRQNWQRSRFSWLVYSGYLLAALPLLATIFDLVTQQGIWLSSLELINYQGGYLHPTTYTQGSLADIIWLTSVSGAGTLVVLGLLYLVSIDPQVFPSARRLGWMLLTTQVTGIGLYIGFRNQPASLLPPILTNLLLAATFSYASYRQMASERHLQRGPLQVRLTLLTIIVTIPVLGSTIIFLTSQAAQRFEEEAQQTLRLNSQHLASSVQLWLEGEIRGYQAVLDSAISQPDQQTAAMQALVSTHAGLGQAMLSDANGNVITSAGGKALSNIANQDWFLQIRDGSESIAQVWDHPNFTTPVLVIALPVSDSLAGAGAFFYPLNALSDKLLTGVNLSSGQVYIFDAAKRVAISSESRILPVGADANHLELAAPSNDVSPDDFPVSSIDGEPYRTYTTPTSFGWSVFVQQPESTLLTPSVLLKQATWLLLVVSIIIIIFLVWLTIRHTLHPITSLTTIADNITSGNLTRTVPVESEDELGILARSMNNMIAQMRGLISNLEQRVSERTKDVERRAVQLQVTAEVASESASIRELERLLNHTVLLISERFDFYHSGIFLMDNQGEYAVLRAASSQGGQRMLARGHKLRVGQTGIVGYVADKGESRVALDVGQDAIYFNNPDLPQTRSEAALPLKVRGQVIGVLDVQSTLAAAFTPEDVQILQVLADQIALAIDNARLFDENRQSLNELQVLYRTRVQKAWQDRMEDRSVIYTFDRLDVQPAKTSDQAAGFDDLADPYIVVAPIELRGWQLGSLSLKRESSQAPWSNQERDLIQNTALQIAQALDNARLLETVQRNAYQEQLIGQIAAKTQSSLVLENVMKTAVQEIGQAIQAERVQIRLDTGNGKPSRNGEESRMNSVGATLHG